MLARVQGAQDEALPAGAEIALARYLRRVSDALRELSAEAPPRAELELLAELCGGGGPTDGALPALADG